MAVGQYIKEQMVRVFEDKVSHSRTIILCSAGGLKAREMDELRVKMKREEIKFFLIKKKLASLAFKKANIDISKFLNGDIFYAFGEDNPVSASKTLVNFARGHEALKIKGGVIDKNIVDANEIKRYASIPGKGILMQQLACRIKAPITNLVLLLGIPLRRLVLALEAVREQKAEKG